MKHTITLVFTVIIFTGFFGSNALAEEGTAAKHLTPADGHVIHVVAPHVVEGKVMGPFHHYCKALSPLLQGPFPGADHRMSHL